MELLQIKYFCHAARNQSFTKTAKEFDVPPSNISQSIKRLERELGVTLFDRRANSIILNEQGKYFYEKAAKALLLLEEGKGRFRGAETEEKIRIWSQSNRRIVMQAVEKFRRSYPHVEISVRYGSEYRDDDDFVVSCNYVDNGGKDAIKLIDEDIMLAFNKANPLLSEEKLDISRLKNESFVSMNEGSNLYALTGSICREHGFEPKIVIRSDDPFYVRKCVEMGLGVAIVPSISWRGQFSENTVLKYIEGYKRTCYLIKNEKKHFSYMFKLFAEMLKEEFLKEAENI